MSKYTTGEIAKRCGVTVRTVQYYDTRGILIPSELTEGGRRLYSENDLKRMKIICFLRDLGLPIDSISKMLAEDDPDSVISLLLEQQENTLREEIGERKERLDRLESLRRDLKDVEAISFESIGEQEKAPENARLHACDGDPCHIAPMGCDYSGNHKGLVVAAGDMGCGSHSVGRLYLKVLLQPHRLPLSSVPHGIHADIQGDVFCKAYA